MEKPCGLNKQPIIFIIDDSKDILKPLAKVLEQNKNEVYCFTNSKELLSHKKLKSVGLFIIDIILDEEDGIELSTKLSDMGIISSRLFISGHDRKQVLDKVPEKISYLYDFISKPIDLNVFINRIDILLKCTRQLQCYANKKQLIEHALWDVFNYSNFYVIALDENLCVKLCSYSLATALGFENEDEILGENWIKFISPSFQEAIKTIHTGVLNNKDEFKEITNEILTKNGKLINVKWFNSSVKNGLTMTFSVGVPLTRNISIENNVESMRSYFKDILERDESMIRSLKNMVMSNKN